MANISPKTVQNFCRACLKELKQEQKYKILRLHEQIRCWLNDPTIDNSLAHDKYPKNICFSCRNKLNNFLEFYEMCKKSRKTIYELWLNDEVNEKKINNRKSNIIDKDNDSEQEESVLPCDASTTHNENTVKTKLNSNIQEPLVCCCFETNILESFDNIQTKEDIDVKELKRYYNRNPPDDLKKTEENFTHTECADQIYRTNLKTTAKVGLKKQCNFSHDKMKRKKYSYSFRCDQCKYRCVSQQTLDIHMRTHFGLKPYQCPKCDEAFDKSQFMLKHLNEVHGEKELTVICEYEECGKQFNSSRSYKEHYRQNHVLQQPIDKQEKSTKMPCRHVCEECGKIYTKLQSFKEHQYTHGPKDQYPFQCDECNKAFVKQRTFNEHKLRHAGIKNFICPHCGTKKTTKKELRSHINIHTREHQYPCPNCPMIFYRSSNRRIHVDVVHQGIRRFACRFCEQTFGKGDNLKNHELLHTGQKPHCCAECGKRFVQKVSLRSHMKIHKQILEKNIEK